MVIEGLAAPFLSNAGMFMPCSLNPKDWDMMEGPHGRGDVLPLGLVTSSSPVLMTSFFLRGRTAGSVAGVTETSY